VTARALTDEFTACAKAALAHDFDPVPWDEAPRWRQFAAYATAEAALDSDNPELVRSAWLLEMTKMGWRWDRVIDENAKTHPGIVFGELTRGGARHWEAVIRAVRDEGRRLGVRMTGR